MTIALSIVSIAGLFYILGKTADLLVVETKILGERLKMRIFFLGIILGFLTSMPELAIGLNAATKNASAISFGNLVGGIIVLFGLILGISVFLNRSIATDGKTKNILPLLIYLFLPLVFGLDGSISPVEGIALIVGYVLLIFHLYATTRGNKKRVKKIKLSGIEFTKTIFLFGGSIIGIILISNLIIRLTLSVLQIFVISPFIIGLLAYSLGTNLPEIMITIRAWKNNTKELSVSNLIGSAIANGCIIGIVAFINIIPVTVNAGYYLLMFFMAVLFGKLLAFYESDSALTRREGIVLAVIYFLFVIVQIALA